ncbi:nuclear transport factor 2 [Trebouxia sp. C0009 RCD-2024]
MTDQSEQIAKAFTDHYYPTFDQNRGALAGLYSDQSVLCFEGQKVQGTQAIVSKLTSLPFQRCQHKVTSLDSHAVPSGGVLVFVTGQLLTEGESRPMPFSQVFHLANISGSWVVTNDIFRLNYG